MIRRNNLYKGLLLCCLAALYGCASVAPYRSYTGASGKGLASFGKLGYSFVRNCEENCRDRDLAENRINRLSCDCDDSRKADSVNTLIYQLLYNYISSLGSLSGGELSNYPIAELGTAVGSTGIVKLEEEQREAFNSLSNLIGNAITQQYRKNKLKSYVSEARQPFNTLVSYLQFNIANNLTGTIGVRKQRLRADYYDLVSQKENSNYDKRQMTERYYELTEALDEKKERLNTYVRLLEEVKAGHEALYKHLDRLNSEELSLAISQHATKINALSATIN